jgi:chromosome partitioning protein
MSLVVSLSVFKGGTTKTTSAVNLAASMVKKGYKVLLVDLDKQANSTRYLGVDPTTINPNLYHVFLKQSSLEYVLKKTGSGIDLIPSTPLLKAIEDAMEPSDRGLLRELLEPFRSEYDFVFIDTPPGSVEMTSVGVVAADLILAPITPDKMAVDGLSDLVKHTQTVLWAKFSKELRNQEFRIFFARYKLSNKHHPSLLNAAKRVYGNHVLDILVPDGIDVSRSYDEATPLINLLPQHPASEAYLRLADWLIDYAKSKA